MLFKHVSGSPRSTIDLGDLTLVYRAFALLALLLVLLPGGVSGADSHPSTSSRVGLVVDLGDGTLVTRCVAFSEAEINGFDVLERSGLEVVTDQGPVCAIAGTGCPASNCWCECQGSPCIYWSYWHQSDGEWLYAQESPTVYTVQDGDVEGWAWGEGAMPSSDLSFEDICLPFRVYLPIVLKP
jgi:hypothetical protein